MSKVIETHEINKTYKMGSEIIQALKSVSISVNKGEYVAFMGPSGSGKSTLMNIIGCLDSPTSGSYILAGKDVSDMSENELADIRNKEIGFVFQTFNLLPRATCLDNVALPLVYAGYSKSEREEIAFKALDNVGLGDRTTHRPNELSIIMVTHEDDIAHYAHRIVRLRDGLVESDKVNPNPTRGLVTA